MPSFLPTWSSLFKTWSFRGDNHHEDPVPSFLLTSRRADSIRASQNLDKYEYFKELKLRLKSSLDIALLTKFSLPACFLHGWCGS